MALPGYSKPRLGIPKVNQNPRLPQQRPFKMALGNRLALNHPHRNIASRTLVAPPSVPGTASAASDPFKTANAAATPAPKASSTTPAGTPPPAPSVPHTSTVNPFETPNLTFEAGKDPRDATYWSNLAKLQFNDQQEYANDLRQQTLADTNYNYALQQAIQARGRQERNLGLETIRSGLTDSGFHDRTDAQQTQAYTEERAHAALTKEQEDQARTAARNALAEGYSIDAAALLAEAAGRKGQIEREEAAKGPGEAGETAAAAPGTGAGQHGYTGTGKAAGPFWGAKGPGGYGYGKGPKKTPSNGGTSYPGNKRKGR